MFFYIVAGLKGPVIYRGARRFCIRRGAKHIRDHRHFFLVFLVLDENPVGLGGRFGMTWVSFWGASGSLSDPSRPARI